MRTPTDIPLAETSGSVTAGAHAVPVPLQAGWHAAPKLRMPENVSPPLPYAPDPVEPVWAFLRANLLRHRVWNGSEIIADACCDAWNKLMGTPKRLATITRRTRARTVSGWGVRYNE